MLYPLYCPRPIKLTEEDIRRASQVHWSLLRRDAEDALREALAVPPGIGVLLVDRCTHALALAMRSVRDRLGGTTAHIPRDTYRATADAARMAELKVSLTSEFSDKAVNVPVTLGGRAITAEWLQREDVVVDAAHTGYWHMFQCYYNWRALVCLSFFPTKPLGAFGGGAIIGPEQVVEHIREQAYPTNPMVPSSFMYPQGIQSIGLVRRLKDENTWEEHKTWVTTAARICNVLRRSGFWLRWDFRVPHVLSFTHQDGMAVGSLREYVQRAGYETGKHYEPLDAPRSDDNWVALPFIYPELEEILAGKYGKQ